MFRRTFNLALWLALFSAGSALFTSPQTFAQDAPPADSPAATKPAADKKATPKQAKDLQPTAEGIAETVIYFSGTREGLAQVRRTGTERGRTTRTNSEGKSDEATYERRFIRGESMVKDRVRLEQKMPTAEYALIFSSGQTWGVINDAVFTPRQETAQDFLARHWHGIDALLRYKENGSTVAYIGREKQMGVELAIVDVTDKEKRKTRFYVSARTGRVLSLEYEEQSAIGGAPVKLLRKFYDYRIAQGTVVPYKSILYRDGKQVEESRILTVTYGAKIDETLFQNPDAPAPAAATSASP